MIINRVVNTIKTILKNKTLNGSLFIALGIFYKITLSIIIEKILALKLGVENFGNYKYGITIVLLLSTISSLGFGSSIIRTLVINSEKKKIISFTLLIVIFSSLLIVISSFFYKTMFYIEDAFVYASFFQALNIVFSSAFSGLEQPKKKVIFNDILGFSTYLIFLLLFFYFEKEYNNISYVYLFYVIIVFLFNFILFKKYYVTLKKRDILNTKFKNYINYTIPLFGVSILVLLGLHLDKFVLKEHVSKTELSVYFAVFNVSNLLPLILTIFVFLYLPKISRLIDLGKKSRASIINSYFSKWTMIIASMFLLVVLLFSEEIIVLLYSKQFLGGQYVLKILVFAQWINVSFGFTGQNLVAFGDARRQLYVRAIAFLFGTILLFFGVKEYGLIGASCSILFALICSNLLQIYVLKVKHNFFGYNFQNIYALIIIFLAYLLILTIHNIIHVMNINILVLMVLYLILFFVILIITKVLNKSDLKILNILE